MLLAWIKTFCKAEGWFPNYCNLHCFWVLHYKLMVWKIEYISPVANCQVIVEELRGKNIRYFYSFSLTDEVEISDIFSISAKLLLEM